MSLRVWIGERRVEERDRLVMRDVQVPSLPSSEEYEARSQPLLESMLLPLNLPRCNVIPGLFYVRTASSLQGKMKYDFLCRQTYGNLLHRDYVGRGPPMNAFAALHAQDEAPVTLATKCVFFLVYS